MYIVHTLHIRGLRGGAYRWESMSSFVLVQWNAMRQTVTIIAQVNGFRFLWFCRNGVWLDIIKLCIETREHFIGLLAAHCHSATAGVWTKGPEHTLVIFCTCLLSLHWNCKYINISSFMKSAKKVWMDVMRIIIVINSIIWSSMMAKIFWIRRPWQ